MFQPEHVYVVRFRFQPPLVESAAVSSVSDGAMELRLAATVPALAGEQLRLLAKSEAGRFATGARIRRAIPGGWRLDVDGWVAVELRENPRVPVDLPATMHHDDCDLPVRIRNVSSSGFLVVSSERPRKKAVRLAVGPDSAPASIACRVVAERKGDAEGTHYVHLAVDADNVESRRELAELFERELVAAISSGVVRSA